MRRRPSTIKIELIPAPASDDRLNSIVIKSIGMAGIARVNTALMPSDATGRRVRKLPIRIEDLR